MRALTVPISAGFTAGCLGGLLNSLAVWAAGAYGITQAFKVALAPAWGLPWLYPRIVWGGIWGLLFVILPLGRRSILARGLLFSLGPTLVQLLVVFPHQLHKGLFGLELGLYTPLFVFIYNAIWGIVAAAWYRLTAE